LLRLLWLLLLLLLQKEEYDYQQGTQEASLKVGNGP
jgi:hypothetical protein